MALFLPLLLMIAPPGPEPSGLYIYRSSVALRISRRVSGSSDAFILSTGSTVLSFCLCLCPLCRCTVSQIARGSLPFQFSMRSWRGTRSSTFLVSRCFTTATSSFLSTHLVAHFFVDELYLFEYICECLSVYECV